MGKCCSAGDIFAYSTPKTVVIRDKVLGFLRLLCIIPIIVYLVYAVIIDGKYYMRQDSPSGAVYARLVRPASLQVDFGNLVYCDQSTLPTTSFPLQCVHMDGIDTALNSPLDNNLVAMTRFRTRTQSGSSLCTGSTCQTPWVDDAGGVTPYKYAAQVEDFAVEVTHYAQGSHLYYATNDAKLYTVRSTTGSGTLRNAAGDVLASFDGTGIADSMTVRQILAAAGVTSLDVRCDSNTCPTGEDVSVRGDGMLIVVFVRYSNVVNLQKAPTYEYIPYRYPREGFSISDALPYDLGNVLSRTVLDRNGIRITFVQTGTIGRFEFPLLFVHVASAVALIMLATLVIDIVMLYVLPRRRFYRMVKYEKDIDFDQVQNKFDKLSENIKGTLLPRSERERLAFEIAEDEMIRAVPPIEREIMEDPELNDRKAEDVRLRLLSGGTGSSARELSDEELEAVFNIIDADDNKQLEFDEVKRAFELMGMPQTDSQILKIMRKLDVNGNGVVDKDEFLLLCKSFPIDFSTRARILIKQHEMDYADENVKDLEFMQSHFEDLDTDRDGRLTYDQVHRFLTDEGIKLSPIEFKVLMQKVDVDGDLNIVFDEFMSLHTMLKAAMEKREMQEADDYALYGSKPAGAPAPAAGAVVPATAGAAVGTAAVAGAGVRVGGSVQNRMNSVNWQGVKTQFRALTNYINGLRDELRELTLIVRMLQRRVIPQTLENVAEHEPVHLAGDWSGEVTEECRLT